MCNSIFLEIFHVIIPKVQNSEGSKIRRFKSPKVQKSEGSKVRKFKSQKIKEDQITFIKC